MRALILTAGLVGCKGIVPYDQPPNVDAPPGTMPVYECSNYTYNGATYNCDTLDLCDVSQESIPQRVACCDCDPMYCNAPAPGTCPDFCEANPTDPVCVGGPPGGDEPAEGCMECHNGSQYNDYQGTGITNPHWTDDPAVQYLRCTQCHGGNGEASGRDEAHVPRPPQIGDDNNLAINAESYFNYLTRTGLDKYPDYTVNGMTYTALDYINFLNPSDTRIVSQGRGCGTSGCHQGQHADWFVKSPINTEAGFYSNTLYSVGAKSPIPESADLYTKTASHTAFRAVADPTWVYSGDPADTGKVPRYVEMPDRAVYGDTTGFYNNPAYDANTIANFRYAANQGDEYVNQIITGSVLQHVVEEAVTFQCGDCHAGSNGANNRYADFRSSGCASCHMKYSMDGKSKSTDPNVPKDEPANPDAIAAPERAHVESHQLRNVSKYITTYFGPVLLGGIEDRTCVGCHQGSNRTVLQYWGVRLDQNQDVVNGFQYPANPVTFQNTAQNTMLFDPAVANATFNGRNNNQYLDFEDYDGDARNDIAQDVHKERGLGCIDCHGSRDVHNGTRFQDSTGAWFDDPNNGAIWSKMDQTVGVQCISCHGDDTGYAYTTSCLDYDGVAATCATDRFGNPLRNVTMDGLGRMILKGRVDGISHYVPQTYDTIVDTGVVWPLGVMSGQRVYSPTASYAMGIADGNPANGVGPMQTNPDIYSAGFTHMETVACDACHAVWINGCIGCHLQLQYNDNAANFFFSNTTGKRITVQVTNADFMYIQPLWYFLEVTPRGEIGSGQPGMKPFYRYVDQNGNTAAGITFSDVNGNGNNPAAFGSGALPALSHNRIYAHSVRGRNTATDEGGKQCVVCHLNTAQIDNFGADYAAYYANMRASALNGDYAFLVNDNLFPVLQQHIGQNTNNHLNSPYFVHMTAGLGTGLLLVDANGCPVNPLDNNANRFFCNGVAPAAQFNIANAAYSLDGVVELSGVANASFTKPLIDLARGVPLRAGGQEPTLSGPMGGELLFKLADPNTTLILDSWIDANGAPQGDAANFVLAAGQY
jgi:hypothetical protein